MGIPKGKIVERPELAAILGYDPKTILVWQKAGMPYVPGRGGGEANEYNTCEVIKWLITREAKGGIDLDSERAKLATAQTKMAELKHAKLDGKLIDIEDATFVVQKLAYAIQQRIVALTLPADEKDRLWESIAALSNVDFTKAEKYDDSEEDEITDSASESGTT